MRSVQVSIHVERFDKQVPNDWLSDDGRLRIHVYADGNNFVEVLMGAVAKTYEIVAESENGYPGVVRLDAVDNTSDNELEHRIVAICEPPRPIDIYDLRDLAALRDKKQNEDEDSI